jgi:hypothetical protein
VGTLAHSLQVPLLEVCIVGGMKGSSTVRDAGACICVGRQGQEYRLALNGYRVVTLYTIRYPGNSSLVSIRAPTSSYLKSFHGNGLKEITLN